MYVTVLRTILYRDQDGTRLLSPPRPLSRDHFHGPYLWMKEILHDCFYHTCGDSKIRSTFLGGLRKKDQNILGSILEPLVLGNYHVSNYTILVFLSIIHPHENPEA